MTWEHLRYLVLTLIELKFFNRLATKRTSAQLGLSIVVRSRAQGCTEMAFLQLSPNLRLLAWASVWLPIAELSTQVRVSKLRLARASKNNCCLSYRKFPWVQGSASINSMNVPLTMPTITSSYPKVLKVLALLLFPFTSQIPQLSRLSSVYARAKVNSVSLKTASGGSYWHNKRDIAETA